MVSSLVMSKEVYKNLFVKPYFLSIEKLSVLVLVLFRKIKSVVPSLQLKICYKKSQTISFVFSYSVSARKRFTI